MTEELQAGIDSMRELIDNASGTDIASASVRFFRELFDHIDALQAKLDAVPVKEIKYYVDVTEPEYELMSYWEDNRPVFENAQNAIRSWVKDVQP